MRRSRKINAYIYKLLIERKMDGFSVIEARDTACSFEESPKDTDEVRKIVYRQIRLCENNGWLRSEGNGRAKRYYKTDLFNSLSFEPRRNRSNHKVVKVCVSNVPVKDYSELTTERNKLKGELSVTLGSIEKYKELKMRFPEQSNLLDHLHEMATKKAALFMGDIDAISNMLNGLSRGEITC